MAAPMFAFRRSVVLLLMPNSSVRVNYSNCRNLHRSSVRFKGADVKHYDLIVIGGGSGGLACSKEAANLGKQVIVLDFVEPSPQGTKWGLGGTCVNVGCIPKKLMHQASLLGASIRDAKNFGWKVPDAPICDWSTLSDNVQAHVKSLNWAHRVKLREKNVTYLNASGFIKDKSTVIATEANGRKSTLTGDVIVIATGTRPEIPPDVPGREHVITSDDIFWHRKPPGKTLCVGAGYVSLETAGFLSGLGFDTTVFARSKVLSRFDQQMVSHVVSEMKVHGTKFVIGTVPTKIEKAGSRLKVTWQENVEQGSGTKIMTDTFDTVLYATGRYAKTSGLGLKEVGVSLDSMGFVIGDNNGEAECSSVSNIYAIGDVLSNCLQLTPVAIRAGKLLAQRLFAKSKEFMDYINVPTTLYTPLEYSFVGLTEEAAIEKHGDKNLDIYHAFYLPLEYTVAQRHSETCYVKVIAKKTAKGEVLGMHYTGPNAGEVMQGFAVALRMGLTRDKLLSTVGIHPTCAEEVVKLYITKESGIDPHVTGC